MPTRRAPPRGACSSWSLAAGRAHRRCSAALAGVIPHAFTTDPRVIDRAHAMWPLFCLLWPFAAVVFALDGILIGAGDARYLAGAMVLAMVVFVPLVLAAGTIAGGLGRPRRADARPPGDARRALRRAGAGRSSGRRRSLMAGVHA